MFSNIKKLYVKCYIFFIKTIYRSNLKTGRKVSISKGSKFLTPTIIGHHTLMGPVIVKGGGEVSIGKYSTIGGNVSIITSNHITNRANLQTSYPKNFNIPTREIKPVSIGNNVWIGDNAMILPGVKIGDGAIIGAGAVVTGEIPAFSIAVGVPAKANKFRFSEEIIGQLQNIKWWDWDDEKIKKNELFFRTDLTKEPTSDLLKKIK